MTRAAATLPNPITTAFPGYSQLASEAQAANPNETEYSSANSPLRTMNLRSSSKGICVRSLRTPPSMKDASRLAEGPSSPSYWRWANSSST